MKKKILSIFITSMMLISCGKDESIKEETNNAEKHNYEVIFTQEGDLNESIVVLSLTSINDGMVASKIIDVSSNENLGNPVLLNMQEKEEGQFSYTNEEDTNSIHVVVTVTVDKDAERDYEYDLMILKDGAEVYHKKHVKTPGTSIEQLSLSY
ncbi:hypothetical protein [Wenyingzhuangia sp. 2_MG-2023]|uniref:hypothetical protein n=1 Tax=Wenyingzhuangia sp. 2_MG-2023 TaxID=3062639 RepID=UPI0026E2EE55|nr:hypothetical protein [Wenyingzhuangia sp. 2_MG-2023]MDO6737389.1 hypothetical protein [Wenyingzhuangia sp. 2_MG-2023]